MKNRRWMKSMINEAKKSDVQMPWARGTAKAKLSARMETRFSTTSKAKAA